MATAISTPISLKSIPTVYSGRRQITTSMAAVTRENVLEMLDKAYPTHMANRSDIEYLYKYYKGIQPILGRVKEVRPEITNRIVENRANAIVTFRVGYTVGKPIQYVSGVSDEAVSQAIAKLNDLMRVSGKASKDKQLVEWMMICGTGYRVILPKRERRASVPFELSTADPRQCFVVYSNDIGHTPLCGVYYTVADNQDVTFHIYTADTYFKVEGWQSGRIVTAEANPVGRIPIIEYPLNMARLGAFEVVLGLLDALNNLNSNNLDDVEQTVQSLLVTYNCEFEDGVTANAIREAGMINLKTTPDSKADIKELNGHLDQMQTQVLKQAILDAINEIAGIPSQSNGHTSDSSNNGAVVLKQGWQGAETRAQDFEQMFSEPEHRLIEIATDICGRLLPDFNLDPNTVEPKFTRRNYEDILSKSQTLITMLNNNKVHPQCAYEACGLFVDTQDAYNMGMDWFKQYGQLEPATVSTGAAGPSHLPEPQQPLGDGEEEKETEPGRGGKHWVKGYWKS